MKKFFNSPWPLIIIMSLGTAIALFTSMDFIVQNDQNDNVRSAEEAPTKEAPTNSAVRKP